LSPFGLSRASEDEIEGVLDDFTDDLEKNLNILIVAKMIGSSVANGAWLRLQESGEAKYE
jgi:hypothetical protein